MATMGTIQRQLLGDVMNEDKVVRPEEHDEEEPKDIQKVYIKDYGNLTLEIKGSNEIGMMAYSEKRKEHLFIPWTSIIFVSKIDGAENEPDEKRNS